MLFRSLFGIAIGIEYVGIIVRFDFDSDPDENNLS